MSIDHNSLKPESIVAGWQESGMTQTEYAKSNNISIHTLRYWIYKRSKKSTPGTAFIELKNIFKGSGILLRYPNGVELQVPAGTSLQVLKTLVNL
jgi:hypothetical protein